MYWLWKNIIIYLKWRLGKVGANMEDLIIYIKEKLKRLDEEFFYYEEKLDRTYEPMEKQRLENLVHDIRVESRTLNDILDQIEGE